MKRRPGFLCARCSARHSPDLKGLAAIPGIAGRSPSYIARQLDDFQQGTVPFKSNVR
jgi:cytochrome c553